MVIYSTGTARHFNHTPQRLLGKLLPESKFLFLGFT